MAEAIPPTSPSKVANLMDGSNGTPISDNLGGTTINVTGGAGDLQEAINGTGAFAGQGAVDGSGNHKGNTYVCPAGATYNPIVLPVAGNGFTCIRSGGTLPGFGTTIVPATHAAQTFKITGAESLVQGAPAGTNGWRFIGMELVPTAAFEFPTFLVNLGYLANSGALFKRFCFERCYMHPLTAATQIRHTVWLEAFEDVQIWDSYIESRARGGFSDDQAIQTRSGNRVYVGHNELRACSEPLAFGENVGGTTFDCTAKRNHLFKPMTWSQYLLDGVTPNNTGPTAWDGINWFVKNSFECKFTQRVLFEGNHCENTWVGADQPGNMLALQTNPVVPCFDVMYRSNLLENAPAGFSFYNYGTDDHVVQRIAVLNNHFKNINARAFTLLRAGEDIWIEHNTFTPVSRVYPVSQEMIIECGVGTAGTSFPRLTIRNNIWGSTRYGLRVTSSNGDASDGAGNPQASVWNNNLPDRNVSENAEFKVTGYEGVVGSSYPPGGITSYASAAAAGIDLTTGILANDSPLKVGRPGYFGTDNEDIGVNFVALDAAINDIPVAPVASFFHLQTPNTLTVVFTDNSSGSPDSGLYDFGDGTPQVAGLNVSHTYAAPAASYFVEHRVYKAGFPDSTTGPVAVAVTAIPLFTHKSSTKSSVVTTTTSRAVTVPSIAVGDLVLVTLSTESTDIPSCADTLGNVYTPVAAAQTFPGITWRNRTFRCVATVAGTNPVITGSFTGATTFAVIKVNIFTYPGTVSYLGHSEGASGATNVAGPMDSGTVPAGVGDILMYGMCDYTATAPSQPTGFVSLDSQGTIAVAQSGPPVAGRYQPTYGGTQMWIAQLDVFAATEGANAPPTCTIQVPTSNPTWPVTTTPLTISGIAADDVAVTSVTWENAATGAIGTANGTATYSIPGIVLAPGDNPITVVAHDAAGLVGSKLLTVTYTPPGTPPTIAITVPTANPTWPTTTTPLALSGTATDDAAVTAVTWANDRGGSGSAVVVGTTSATWSVTGGVPLQPGVNVVTVTARDAAQNATPKVLTVTYTPPPQAPFPPDLMRGFGPDRGVAANDFILIPLTSHSAQSTFRQWASRDGSGARCLWTKSSNAIQSFTEAILAPGDGLLHFYRRYNLGTGEWTCPEPTAGARYCLVFKIDTGAPTALPIVKLNNVIQPLTVVRQPGAGETPVNTAAPYMLGNWPGQTGSWLGDQAKWTKNAYLTSDQEDTDFYEGDNPMTIGVAPVAYHVLDGTDADEPSAVSPFTDSVVTGTQPQNYAVTAPPTVALSVTAGSPAQGIPYQVTAATTGTVDRIGFFKDTVPPTGMVLVREDAVAPYTLFAAPAVLGPGAHTIEARAYETAGATVADTDTLNVTEPSATTGTWTVEAEICDRIPTALSYDVDLDTVFQVNVLQPATGNPHGTVTFAGSDVGKTWGITPIFAGGPGTRFAITPPRYTDPSATPPEGFKEVARAYVAGTTTWTVTYRVNRKPAPVLSYDFRIDGSLAGNVLQPASGNPTYVATFTGADVTKVINVSAVYVAGEGPRMGITLRYVAPATNAPTGFQELSRTFTP